MKNFQSIRKSLRSITILGLLFMPSLGLYAQTWNLVGNDNFDGVGPTYDQTGTYYIKGDNTNSFIGNSGDYYPLIFKTNNIERLRVNAFRSPGNYFSSASGGSYDFVSTNQYYSLLTINGRTNIYGTQNALRIISSYSSKTLSDYYHYLSIGNELRSNNIEYSVINSVEYCDNCGTGCTYLPCGRGVPKHLLIQDNLTGGFLGIGNFDAFAPTSKLTVNGVTQVLGTNVPDNTKAGLTLGNVDYAVGSLIKNLPGYSWIQSNPGRPLILNPTPTTSNDGNRNYVAIGFSPENLPANPNGKLNGYMLAVNGSVMCTLLRVQNKDLWPDYVFEKGYKLPELNKVEENLKRDKHLDGIPSAQEVKENGVDVGEMNAKLLQKVEELYLYVIEQNKEIATLKSRLDSLSSTSK